MTLHALIVSLLISIAAGALVWLCWTVRDIERMLKQWRRDQGEDEP